MLSALRCIGFVWIIGIAGCSRSVTIAQDASSDAPNLLDQSAVAVADSSVVDVLTRVDTMNSRDAGSLLDASNTGRCDPMRVRARNSGRRCWDPPVEIRDRSWACGSSLHTCQLGVCCSGRINPETCDCECPVSDAPCDDEPLLFSVCCLEVSSHDGVPPRPPGCALNGECAASPASEAWIAARRDR